VNAPDDTALPDLVDRAAVASVVVDGTGRMLEASGRAAELLGVDREELNATYLRDIAADGWDRAVHGALSRLTSGSLDDFHLLLRGRSGRHRLVQMTPHRLKGSRGARHFLLVWREHPGGPEPTAPSDDNLDSLPYGLLRTHEAERGRVAGELREHIEPLVAMAKFMVEDAAARDERGAQPTAQMLKAVKCLREVLSEVRRISNELRPSSLHDLGLRPTIEWLSRHFAKAHPDVRIDLEFDIDEASFDESLRVELFRIVEEALINVGRHAHASRVRVALVKSAGQVELKVEDDGIGFDRAAIARGAGGLAGVGLRSIGERVDATNGSLAIESAPLRGTSIAAVWPLKRNAAGRR
jgi:two-component system NarL family sensor kinase